MAVWHTHGGYIPGIDNENFSSDDKNYAKDWGQDIYLATPNDLFKQYVPPVGNKNEEEINRGKL